MMLHAGDLAARREQLVEVTSPTRRVIAGPMSADGRPAQDRFDAPARPIGGLRLFLPNGLQNLQDERGIDRVDGRSFTAAVRAGYFRSPRRVSLKVATHWSPCFGFRQPARFASM